MARRLLDRSRLRESRRQAVLLNKLARQFRPMVARELSSAMADMADHWEQTLVVEMPRGFPDRMAALYIQMADASIRTFAGRVLDQGKSAGLVTERKFLDFAQVMNTLAAIYIGLEGVRRRIASVTETTRQQVITIVARGYQAGMPVREVADDIRDKAPGISKIRARTIARTETHGAANFGANEAAKKTGLPLRREWLAAHDMRTRTVDPLIGDADEFGHMQADGQIVGMEEPFLVPRRGGGQEALMYPGDPNGSPGNVIACRCTVGFIVDDGLDDEL